MGNEIEQLTLHEGEVFGERALIKKEPRKANIIASGPVECYYLESQDFYAMLGEWKIPTFCLLSLSSVLCTYDLCGPLVSIRVARDSLRLPRTLMFPSSTGQPSGFTHLTALCSSLTCPTFPVSLHLLCSSLT
jgi:hypothetical protein